MSKTTNKIGQICTHEEFEQFKSIQEGLGFLLDRQADRTDSAYSYKQTEVLEKAKDFWPRLEQICDALNIRLEIDLEDLKKAVFGFEPLHGEESTAICCNSPYVGMPMFRVIPLEEERVKRVAKRNLDAVMVHLRKYVGGTDEKISVGTKAPETEQKTAINVNISGGVQADNLQIGHDSSIHRRTGTQQKTKGILKKSLKIGSTIVVSIIAAVVADIFADFGLIKIIKSVVYSIFTTK